jgi:hypothetical protein
MTATQIVSLSLAGGTSAPAEARAVLDTLRVRLSPGQRDDLRLAITELVTRRVVERSPEAVDLQITVSQKAVRVEVGHAVPDAHAIPGRERAGDRGLAIIDGVAARWGTRSRGRSSWFEVDLG